MGWRQDLIRVGITAGLAASMGKGGEDRARKALEAAFPELTELAGKALEKKPVEKGKTK